MVHRKGQEMSKFIDCLYGLTSRGLFLHIPDAIYMVLMIAAHKKQEIQGLDQLKKEKALINYLLQYCNQNEGNHSNILLGYASILLIAYGDTSNKKEGINNSQIESIFVEH
jgi:hypothetical protein